MSNEPIHKYLIIVQAVAFGIVLALGVVSLYKIGHNSTNEALGEALRVFTVTQGGTGTGVSPSKGYVLVGQTDGTYLAVATSTLGISAAAGGTGGSGTISTSTTIATGTLAYFNGLSTIASVATGTLTTTATGLEFDNTRGVVGGASILSLTAGYQIPTTTRMATWDAKGNGTVTSVDMSVPTGLSISGNPITTSGTLALGLTAGYNIPLTASSTNWNTAYGWGNHATAGYDQVITAGDGLTRTVNDFDCDTASGSVFGCLSSANWTTFNGKQNALSVTHPIRLIGDTLSLAFSTTTANAWSSLQTFGYASSTGMSGTNLNFTNATSTSFFSTLGTFTNAVVNTLLSAVTGAFTNLTATNATTTNLVTTSLKIGSDTITDITGTNLSVTGGVLSASGGSASPGESDSYFQYNNGGSFAGASTTHNALRFIEGVESVLVGTTSQSAARLEVGNQDSTFTSDQIRIISNSSSGGNADVHISSPDADIEFCDETGGTSPAGCFEINALASNNQMYFTPRNAANSSFADPLITLNRDASTAVGSVGIGTRFDTPGAMLEIAGTSTQTNLLALTDTFGGTDGNRMMVKRTGFVGIGETNPDVLLHIATTSGSATHDFIKLENTGGFAEGGAGIRFQNSAGSVDMARIYARPGSSYADSSLIFSVADSSKVLTERMRIGVAGGVGIGTTSKAAGMEVTGKVYAHSLTASAGTPSSICQNASTKEITVNAALTCTVSARDQKDNIKAFKESALAKVMRLTPSLFVYRDDYDRERLGFIADEVQAVDPLLGDAYKDGEARSIDLPALIALNTKAIQELYAMTGEAKKTAQDNWQWVALFALFGIVVRQQLQINKLK